MSEAAGVRGMRPLVGTCQVCRREHPLDDGRHVAAHTRYPGSIVERACSGSDKLSTEARDANAAKSHERPFCCPRYEWGDGTHDLNCPLTDREVR